MQELRARAVVQAATQADLVVLGGIWQELMTLHEERDHHFALAPDALRRWREMAEEMLLRGDAFVFKATFAGTTVGFCLGWVAVNPAIYRRSEVGFISEIAVRRRWQRHGVGRALVAQARRWFHAHGLDEFQLSTAIWNDAAHHFWEKVGGKRLLVRYRFDTEG